MTTDSEKVTFLPAAATNEVTPTSTSTPLQHYLRSCPILEQKAKPTGFLLMSCLAAGLAQGSNTFHMSIVNLGHVHIQRFINDSVLDHYGKSMSIYELDIIWGAVMGMPLIIAMLSSMSVQWLAETFGRKASLFYIHSTGNVLAGGLCAVAQPLGSVELFLLGRLMFGVCLGVSVSLASMYMTECSPTRHRGMCGAFLGISGTSLFTFSMTLSLPEILGSAERWPYIYVILILFSLCAICLAFCVLQESPKFLYINRKDKLTAFKAISKLHGTEADCPAIFHTYDQEAEQANSISTTTFHELFNTPHLRRGVLIGSLAAMGRSLCGINIIYGYSAKLIASSLALPMDGVRGLCLAVQSPQLVACLITLFIIDRVPRRKFFLWTLTAMMALFTTFITLSSHIQNQEPSIHVNTNQSSTNCSTLYIQSGNANDWLIYPSIGALMLASWIFPLGVTPIGFILVSEITPQAARSKAVSLAMLCLHTTGTIQYFFFPILNHLIGIYSMLVLVVAPEIIIVTLLYRYMPETLGRTVAEVIEPWVVKNSIEMTGEGSRQKNVSKLQCQ